MGLSDLFNKKKQTTQIRDDDPIYKILDELNNEGEYDKILQKIDEIPGDKWSNELWFRRISALNNLSRFNEAKKEISLLSRRCSGPKDDARLYYSLGYILDHTNSELKAVECFLRTQEFDPEFEGIQDVIDDSMKRANQNLTDARNTIEKLFADVATAIGNASNQCKLDDNSAFSYISMIESSFIPYGIGIEIPLDKLFFKCENADKPKMKRFLEEKYEIKDIQSLQQWFGNNRIAPDFNNLMIAIEKKMELPLNKMSPSERMHMRASMLVIQYFKDLIPEEGIAAWDYCSVLALARMAFSCDLLSNVEFLQTALFFTDECKEKFSSWEEFTRSVVIGGFYNTMCFDTQYDIESAVLFSNAAGTMCKQNYPKVTWIR